MPEDSLTAAVKEAYASVPKGVVILHTLQLTHEDVAEDIFMVRDRTSLTATLEDMSTETFQPIPFRFILPKRDDSGVPDMTIAIDNVEQEASDYLESIKTSRKKLTVIYRPYLSNDLTQPQQNPPLQLTLRDVEVRDSEVVGRATFADVRNKKYIAELYTRLRFPSLGQ